MILEYTPETDTLFIQFKKTKKVEGETLNSRTVAYFTASNEIAALEIEHAKKVVDLNTIEINGKSINWAKKLSRPKAKK